MSRCFFYIFINAPVRGAAVRARKNSKIRAANFNYVMFAAPLSLALSICKKPSWQHPNRTPRFWELARDLHNNWIRLLLTIRFWTLHRSRAPPRPRHPYFICSFSRQFPKLIKVFSSTESWSVELPDQRVACQNLQVFDNEYFPARTDAEVAAFSTVFVPFGFSFAVKMSTIGNFNDVCSI